MDFDIYIKGALADLANAPFPDAALITGLQQRGLTGPDARLLLEKAVMEGWVARTADGLLQKSVRAAQEAVPGQLAKTDSGDLR